MVDDLSDPWKELRELKRRVRMMENSTPLENASVTDGRVRFISGLLRVDSGGRVEIVGTLDVEGQTTVTGRFDVNGPWALAGDGDITGDVDVTGDIEVLGGGRFKVGNVVVTPGSGGRVTVGTGSSRVVLNGSDGTIKAGSLTIDPTEGGGAIVFDNGAQVFSHATNNQIEMISGQRHVTLDDHRVEVATGDRGIIMADAGASIDEGIYVTGVPTGTASAYLALDSSNRLVRAAGGTGGGPGDGIFAWSFPLDQVTSEFRSAERPTHDGIDFGIGPSNTEGTPIPSMGGGTVDTILSVNDGTHGWGNGVIINHGIDPLYGDGTHEIKTLYAHMSTAPAVSLGDPVALGDTLGPIGNTGNSFGAHLHLEVHVDDAPVDPRAFMAEHGA